MQNPKDSQKKARSPFQGFMPFFWLALSALGGVWLADKLALPIWFWVIGLGLSLVLWILALTLPRAWALTHWLASWTHTDRRLPGIILAAFLFLAGWRYCAEQPEMTPEWIGFYNERGTVVLAGDVIQPPDERDTHTNLILHVNSLKYIGKDAATSVPEIVSGNVLVQVQPGVEYSYGDQIIAQGNLEIPFESESFSYQDYLARKDIYSIMPYARVERIAEGGGSKLKACLYNLREHSRDLLDEIFPSPEADLMAGILLGLDQGLSPNLQEAFQDTGTTHIIAISGFNMAILAGLFTGVFTRLIGRRWGSLAAILGIAVYTVFVGGEAAVVRAAIMGGLGVMGGIFGRRQTGLNSLGLAVFGMVLLDPNLPWDIGFQLSGAATLGLILYGQPLEDQMVCWLGRWLPEEKASMIIGPLSEVLLFTLAAQVMTLPIIAYHFRELSWIAFLANPLILPPQPLVLILGGLALLAAWILPGLGYMISFSALPFVRYTIRAVTWLAGLPGGSVTLDGFHPLWLLVFYGFLFFLTLIPREKQKTLIGQIQFRFVGMLALVGLNLFVWTRILIQPDGRLHLTLLDAEGTILVQAPGGGTALIGGGSSPSHLKQALGDRLPHRDLALDWVLVASPARDDLNALLGGFQPGEVGVVLWGIDPSANQTSRRVYSRLLDQEVQVETMATGQALDLGEGIRLEVIALEQKGALFWLAWGNFNALLPAGKVGETWLQAPDAPDVLLLPDDISSENLPLPTINAWSSSVILLPLKASELPLQGTHELVTLLDGYPLLNSLDYGWVRVSTDGSQVWVEAER
jgi:competence protein ComEC